MPGKVHNLLRKVKWLIQFKDLSIILPTLFSANLPRNLRLHRFFKVTTIITHSIIQSRWTTNEKSNVWLNSHILPSFVMHGAHFRDYHHHVIIIISRMHPQLHSFSFMLHEFLFPPVFTINTRCCYFCFCCCTVKLTYDRLLHFLPQPFHKPVSRFFVHSLHRSMCSR